MRNGTPEVYDFFREISTKRRRDKIRLSMGSESAESYNDVTEILRARLVSANSRKTASIIENEN